MHRLFALLILLPNLAWADWSPRPNMFTYDATFDLCIADPTSETLVQDCDRALMAAYLVKRAVAWATSNCPTDSIADCPETFEDEGLPAIAAQIAVDSGCDNTDVLELPEQTQIPADHCITVASDIMIDEGIVPLNTYTNCGIDWIECGDLAFINATLWADQLITDTPERLQATMTNTQARNARACESEAQEVGGWGMIMDAKNCEAERSANLWADLAQQAQEN